VQAQRTQPESILQLYRDALALRRREPALGDGPLVWQRVTGEVLDFVRPHPAGALRCVINLGAAAVALPSGQVLLSSGPLPARELPPDTGVWLRA
jgi:alpha-glucosidase